MLSTRAISSNVYEITRDIKMKKKDRGIIFSPPAYAMGLSQILSFMLFKCSFLIYNSGLRFPNDLKIKIINYKISILNISVSAFKILFKNFKKQDRFLNIRLVMAGGMQFSKTDHINYKKKFPNSKIINFYGCTENSPRVSHFKFSKNQLKKYRNFDFLPVGKAIKGTKIIIKASKNSRNHGEIILSGNSLMRGYLNMTSNIKKTLIYKTNDIGFFSLDRKLFVTGRLDNIFKSGNEKISPEEIEDKISPFLKNRTFIIAKKKHTILNWKPILIVEGKKTESDKNLLENLEKNLSNFKLPSEIYYLKFFFRNSYGKIDRKKIFNYITNNVN